MEPMAKNTFTIFKRFIIKIANSSNPDFTFGLENRISYSTHHHLVAKTR